MTNNLWMKHDVNSRNSQKLLKLRSQFGYEGVGLYWSILEMIAESEQCAISYDLELLAFSLGYPQATLEATLGRMIEVGLFQLSNTGEYLTSETLLKRFEEMEEQRQKMSAGGKKGRSIQLLRNTNGGTPRPPLPIPPEVHSGREEKRRVDKSREENSRVDKSRGPATAWATPGPSPEHRKTKNKFNNLTEEEEQVLEELL